MMNKQKHIFALVIAGGVTFYPIEKAEAGAWEAIRQGIQYIQDNVMVTVRHLLHRDEAIDILVDDEDSSEDEDNGEDEEPRQPSELMADEEQRIEDMKRHLEERDEDNDGKTLH